MHPRRWQIFLGSTTTLLPTTNKRINARPMLVLFLVFLVLIFCVMSLQGSVNFVGWPYSMSLSTSSTKRRGDSVGDSFIYNRTGNNADSALVATTISSFEDYADVSLSPLHRHDAPFSFSACLVTKDEGRVSHSILRHVWCFAT